MFKWYSEIPCLTVITLIRMIFVYSYSKKGPIKTKYLFDKVFWLVVAVFLEYDYKLLLKICMTINPGKNFIIILQNYPIRTIFILDTMFWLDGFKFSSTKFILWGFKTSRPYHHSWHANTFLFKVYHTLHWIQNQYSETCL